MQCAARHCLQKSTCDKQTGQCVGGCQPGWKQHDCTQGSFVFIYLFTYNFVVVVACECIPLWILL